MRTDRSFSAKIMEYIRARNTKKTVITFLVVASVLLGIGVSAAVGISTFAPHLKTTIEDSAQTVLGAATENPNFIFNVNIPSFFKENATFEKDVAVNGGLTVNGKLVLTKGLDLNNQDLTLGTGNLTAANVLYGLTPGAGIIIGEGQTPTITNTGVLSLQGKSGDIKLIAGTGIGIDGLTISSTATQDAFKTVSVGGTNISASGTDTLSFAAGTGITLSLDPSTKQLTIAGGQGGVTGLNGLTGNLTLANATTTGSTITVNDASTTQKGIAEFNSTNFTAINGMINLIQDIAQSASPVFAAIRILNDAQIERNLTVTNDATVGGNLSVTGTSTLSDLAVANLATISGGLNVTGGTLLAPTASGTDTLTLRAAPGNNSNILNVTNTDGSQAYLTMNSAGSLTINGSTLTNAGILESGGAIHLTDSTNAVVGTAVAKGWSMGGNDFTYRRQITVTNNSASATLPINHPVTITFTGNDATDICSKSRTDSTDIRMSFNTTEKARNLTRTCTTSITIKFQLSAAIAPSSSSNTYYVYYGNADLTTVGPTFTEDFELDSLDTTVSSWTSSDPVQFPVSQDTTSMYHGIGALKAISTRDNIGTFSAANQGGLDAAISHFGSLSKTIGGITYFYTLGGSTDGTAGNARSTIYRTSVNNTTGNVVAGTTNTTSLPTSVIDSATTIVVPPIDAGNGSDGTFDLSLGGSTGGCSGRSLSWSGSTCTIITTPNPVDGSNVGGAPSDGAHTITYTSGSQSGQLLIIVGGDNPSTYFYNPTTDTLSDGPDLGSNAGSGSHSFLIPSGTNAGKYLTVLGNGTTFTKIFDPETNTYSNGPATPSNVTNGSHSFQIPSGPQAGKIITVRGGGSTTTFIYDPATNSYGAGPALTSSVNYGGFSFLLTSGINTGKVLTSGASGNTSLYDPSTNTYSTGASSCSGMFAGGHYFPIPSGTNAGKYMIIGAGNVQTTTIYDPDTNTCSAGPSIGSNAFTGAHSILIPSGSNAGKILTILGGNGFTTKIYDPATNTFGTGPQLTNVASAGVSNGAFSLLIETGVYSGKILTIRAFGRATTELFDPSTSTYGTLGPAIGSPVGVGGHSFVIPSGVHAGEQLIVLGYTSSRTRIYNPLSDTYIQGPDLSGNVGYGAHSYVIPSGVNAGKILTVLGNSTSTTQIYNPATNTYTSGPDVGSNVSDGAHSFVIPSGVNAGKILTVTTTSTTRIYDPSTNTYGAGPSLGGSKSGGSHSFLISSGINAGKMLTVLSGAQTATRIYDPATNSYSTGPSLTFGANSTTHSFVIPSGVNAGKILTIIGNNSSTTNIYDPETNTFTLGPSLKGTVGVGALSIPLTEGSSAGKILTIIGNGNGTNIYDPTTNTFNYGKNLPQSIQNGANYFAISSGINQGKIVLIIGSSTSQIPSAKTILIDVGKDTFNFSSINIPVGTTLTSDGPYSDNNGPHLITFKATGNVTIGGTINLTGKGYAAQVSGIGYGPGAPTAPSTGGACGGSYGGLGGLGGNATCTLGPVYTEDDSGSGGYRNNTTSIGGNSGGGGITINSSTTISVTGTINTDSTSGNASGGSGGLIHLTANVITNSGILTAKGGNAGGTSGSGGNGGGGGGRVKLSYLTSATQGTISVNGGTGGSGTPAGSAGENGVITISSIAPTIFNLGGRDITNTPIAAISQATVDGNDGSIGSFSSSDNQLPQNLFGLTAQSINIGATNYLYTMGGNNGAADQNTIYKFAVTGSSLGTGTTSGQSQLPVALSQHASAIGTISASNYIWVVGGKNGASVQSAIYRGTIDGSGNVTSMSSDQQAALPVPLYGHTVTFVTSGVNNYLYIIGGKTTGDIKQTTVYKATLDTTGNVISVETLGQAQLSTALSDHGAFVATDNSNNQALYTVGGETTTTQSTIKKSIINTDQTTYTAARTDFAAQDFSNKNDLSFWVKANQTGTYLTLQLNTGTAGSPNWQNCNFSGVSNFSISSASTWEEKVCDMTGIVSRSAVTGLRLRVMTTQASTFTVYLDHVQAFMNYASVSNSTSTLASVLGSANLTLNAQGTGIVAVNYDPTDSRAGSGGMTVYNGGSGRLFSIDSVGNASISGTMVTSGNVGIATSDTSHPLTVGSNGTNGNGAYVSTGGTWTNGSSRDYKENITEVDYDTILQKIEQLGISQWNYKLESPSVQHIGPIAEDFHAIFSVGEDDKHISTIDPAGIALAGIKALSKKIDMLMPNFASSSALLSTSLQDTMNWNQATVSGTLMVLGRTTVNDLGVTGKITSGIISVTGETGEINALGTLRLQRNMVGPVDLFAGKVVFSPTGDMKTEGAITVSKVNIDTSNPETASLGKGMILHGQTEVVIKSQGVTADSAIFVTPQTITDLPLGVVHIIPGRSFTVGISKPQTKDIPFKWWIVN